ncbi:hypothetical protein TNCV_2486981 [Trichonephila clavipes]|uniref:Uncharacterized protein n=1 Tax=Trichonephila clavipes TaxID=2585209 RepID=A0A8X7BBC9_TRICX|nr:hypothetical protein TNCV_2486981 [Trichonephila clavipes]
MLPSLFHDKFSTNCFKKIFTQGHHSSRVEEEKTGFFHLVPLLLKEHLLNEQTQPMANNADTTVHFHRTAVFTEHPGFFWNNQD